MKKDEKPKVWPTLLALLLGLVVLIAAVGLALLFAKDAQPDVPLEKLDKSWGIFSDSPIRNNR